MNQTAPSQIFGELHWLTVFCFPSFNNYLPLDGSSLLSHDCLASLKALRNMLESFLETQIHLSTKPCSSLWLLSPSMNNNAWYRFPFIKKKFLGSSKVYDISLFNNSFCYYSFYCLLIGEALYRNMPVWIIVWLRQCAYVLMYFPTFFVGCHENITAWYVSVESK